MEKVQEILCLQREEFVQKLQHCLGQASYNCKPLLKNGAVRFQSTSMKVEMAQPGVKMKKRKEQELELTVRFADVAQPHSPTDFLKELRKTTTLFYLCIFTEICSVF